MKIFVLLSRIPYPIDKGDKLRAYHMLRLLKEKHQIKIFALDEENSYHANKEEFDKICDEIIVEPLSKINIALNLIKAPFSKIPAQVHYFHSLKVEKRITKEIENFRPDVIFCQLIRMAEYVKDIQNIPKVIDYIDVLSKGLERRISKSNPLLRQLVKIEYNRVVKYEREVYGKFSRSLIITSQDRDQLPLEEKTKVEIIPNGIDINFFKPRKSVIEYDLIFSGNLSYPPNVAAAIYISNKIMPLLLKKRPNSKALIFGASPSKKVLKLASSHIDILSWVEDITEYYAKGRVFVAPMEIGTGLQNKLLNAMAMKIPCITSSLSQKGIEAKPDEEILIANDAYQYANKIFSLLENEEFANSIGVNGYKFVHDKYNWRSIVSNLDQILTSLAKS